MKKIAIIKISRKWGEKPHFRLILVGVTGFEPAASKSQTSRATSCATPRLVKIFDFLGQIRKWSNLWSKVFCRNTRRRKSEKTRGKRRFCELSAVGSRGGHTLPKQAGNRYPTSRYSVFGVKSVGVQIKGARDPALRIRSTGRLSPPRLSCSGSEPPGTPHIHFCLRRQSDLPYCRRKCRRTDASAG